MEGVVGIIRGCITCFTEEPRRGRNRMGCANPSCKGGVVDTYSASYWGEQMAAKLEEIEMADDKSVTDMSAYTRKVEGFKKDVERLCHIYRLCFEPIAIHHPPYEDAFIVIRTMTDEQKDLEPLRNC